jgi:hypothetical protein
MGAAVQHNMIAISQTSEQSSYRPNDAKPSQDGKQQQACWSQSSSSSSTQTGCWNSAIQALSNPKHWGRPDDRVRVKACSKRTRLEQMSLVLHVMLF